MLNIIFKRGVILNKRIFTCNIKKLFSLKSNLEEMNLETKEEREIRYEDELFYFEKEWKKLQEDKIKKRQDYVSNHLSPHQEREVETIVKIATHLSVLEQEYFELCLENSIKNVSSTEAGKLNIFNYYLHPKLEVSNPVLDPNRYKRDQILTFLAPYIASGYFTGGAGGSQSQEKSSSVKEAKKEAKAPEPEKLVFFY